MTHFAAKGDIIDPPDLPEMRDENIRLHDVSGLSTMLIGGGALLVVANLIFGASGLVEPKHAMTLALVGIVATLAISLGAMFFVMAFYLVNAGWVATIRRQFENVMHTMWVPGLLFVVWVAFELLGGGIVSSWMDPHATSDGTDYLYQHKQPYLNTGFAVMRLVIYFSVFALLRHLLWFYSTEQDHSGNKWLTNRARFHSAWGMLAFALCATFFAFDWMMALTDFHFFSTMWGVYFFAGAAFSSAPTVVLVLAALRRKGLMQGVVSEEHLHDLGKLMFGFTVFWAYIAFGQYFLIWYSNIPEETAWYAWRKNEAWSPLTVFLVLGHFAVPFYFLLWRALRRSFALLALFAGWAIFMHIVDIYWILRPAVYTSGLLGDEPGITTSLLVDVVGVGGPLLLFAGFLVRQIGAGPLAALRDPRLHEALEHRNYV